MAQQSAVRDESSDSDEEYLHVDECSSSEEEAEDAENAAPDSEWTEETHDVTSPPFTGEPASILPRNRAHTELGYLQCFLTPTLLATIATNTNAYAATKQAPPGWATTPAEVWLFISVHIFMGIVRLPYIHQYWEGQWRQQYVVDAFSRDRFKALLSYFHVAEPTPAGVKPTVVDKIKPLYDHCLATFPECFTPPEVICLDETMVKYKGPSPITTVIRNKPIPIGYKLYTIGSSGYLLYFRLYFGKGGYMVKQGVLHHTVVDMVQRWAGSNRILFTDNLYTSPTLCRHLLTIGLRSCGTFRPNRKGLPAALKDTVKTLGQGEVKGWQSGQLGCMAWCDKGPVLMLSTHHRVDDMVAVQQDRGPSQPPVVLKPQVVLDYNVGKCGVDTVDQLRASYCIQRKSMKNWPSLAWWLIDICVVNSYTLWRLDTKAHITQLDFRKALLKQIPAAYPPPCSPTHLTPPPPLFTTADSHWPRRMAKRRECRHCSQGRMRRVRTGFTCEACGVFLCVDSCFKAYHVGQREGD